MTFRTELLRHAEPLADIAPSATIDDLQVIVDSVAGATVIGLGEATHGTREFFQLRHRMIMALVERLDIRVIILESNFAETFAINQYVIEGVGSPESALDQLRFWTWKTEAMRDLLKWVRTVNRDRPDPQKIRFYGGDIQSIQGSATVLKEFLGEVRTEDSSELESELDLLAAGDQQGTRDWVVSIEVVIEYLRLRFEDHERRYRSAVTEREWRLIQQHLRVINQARRLAVARMFDGGESPNSVRDRSMAENVSWALEQLDVEQGVVCAHNGHIRRGKIRTGTRQTDAPTLGTHLHHAVDRYHAIGFEFGRGSFQAYPDPDSARPMIVQEFSVDPIQAGTVASLLNEANRTPCYINLRSIPRNTSLATELDSKMQLHNIGSIFPSESSDRYVSVELSAGFDGLVVIEESTKTIRLS